MPNFSICLLSKICLDLVIDGPISQFESRLFFLCCTNLTVLPWFRCFRYVYSWCRLRPELYKSFIKKTIRKSGDISTINNFLLDLSLPKEDQANKTLDFFAKAETTDWMTEQVSRLFLCSYVKHKQKMRSDCLLIPVLADKSSCILAPKGTQRVTMQFLFISESGKW